MEHNNELTAEEYFKEWKKTNSTNIYEHWEEKFAESYHKAASEREGLEDGYFEYLQNVLEEWELKFNNLLPEKPTELKTIHFDLIQAYTSMQDKLKKKVIADRKELIERVEKVMPYNSDAKEIILKILEG